LVATIVLILAGHPFEIKAHITLTVYIGVGLFHFLQYQWFLPMVVAENFLHIAGMGIVIVKFLYPNSSKYNNA
jgi:hypothetical protein